ncbi:hypothetical protein PUN28_004558 [Cardiocondyla obscurior]|uniref:Secreted protein n=1 Tax=Cardiocondyla obscurior TaxID=286306 RepID=A0AAW2GE04_9HYME
MYYKSIIVILTILGRVSCRKIRIIFFLYVLPNQMNDAKRSQARCGRLIKIFPKTLVELCATKCQFFFFFFFFPLSHSNTLLQSKRGTLCPVSASSSSMISATESHVNSLTRYITFSLDSD